MVGYQRGGHSLRTMFVSYRALQPRLAEQARLASTSGRMWSAALSPDAAAVATAAGR